MVRFYVIMGGILAFNALTLAFLAWTYNSPRFAEQRFSQRPGIKVTWAQRIRTMLVIGTLSLVAIGGSTYLLYPWLLTEEATSGGMIALQAVGVLVLYDFAYYFLHRAMHHKKAMRYVHGVHHRARNPSALESFYLHPIELFAGVGLLVATTLVLGPVHVDAFLIIFFVYSTLNIMVHAGVDYRNLPMRPFNYLARKHHVHHQDDFAKNFSSLTPLPDMLFRTAS